ncbi:uncharacterized protein LOC133371256 [Rhineura floridana]|uniref:uncharacterized protein LOC133371256 n=1 Tax=Rhineura floridana TaxID=261503 RepID=UPI002AC842CC|nr:uncharacterized protein LOC133371256 [Rhineura floridana]
MALLCALVPLLVFGGASAGTEEDDVGWRERAVGASQSWGQRGEAKGTCCPPEDIWLDKQPPLSLGPLERNAGYGRVEAKAGPEAEKPVDWDFNIVLIILLIGELVCIGLFLYHRKFQRCLWSCLMRCCRCWHDHLSSPSRTPLNNSPQPYGACVSIVPSSSAAEGSRRVRWSPLPSDDASSVHSSRAGAEIPRSEGFTLCPVTLAPRTHCSPHHTPEAVFGEDMV